MLVLQRARAAVSDRTVVVGESANFQGGIDWLRDIGVRVVDVHSEECVRLLRDYISTHAGVWNEDIGEG